MSYVSTYAFTAPLVRSIPTDGAQRGTAVVGLADGNSLMFWDDTGSGTIMARRWGLGSNDYTDAVTIADTVVTSQAGSGNIVPVSAVRITNGNVVVTWARGTASASDIYFAILDADMNLVVGPTAAETGSNRGIRPDVAATATGFVIAWEQAVTASHHDITYRRFDASGASTDAGAGIAVESLNVTDEAPSVAVLADGGIVFAWDRYALGANGSVYEAIVNGDTSVRLAPTLVDNNGTVARDVDLALRPGGYALLYEESAAGSGNTAIVARTFGANGLAAAVTTLIDNAGTDTDVAAATSSNGFTVALASFLSPTADHGRDLVVSVLAPDGSTVIANRSLYLTAGDDLVPSVTWVSDGMVRFGYETTQNADVGTGLFELTRTTTGDGSDDTVSLTSDNLRDTIYGGAGNDALASGGGRDTLYGQDGGDRLYGGADNDTLNGGVGNDVLVGGTDADSLYGGTEDDVLLGGDGNDFLYGGSGSNELQGGLGDDVYTLSVKTDSIIEDAGGGHDTVQTALGSYTLPNNVEDLVFDGTSSPFIGIGNTLDNAIVGGTGRDELYGREGNDVLYDLDQSYQSPVSGNEDTLIGGPGNDTYYVTLKGDSTLEYAGEGIDTVMTAIGVYGLQANVENLTLLEDGPHDAAVGNVLDNVIRGSTLRDSLFGREGNDTLYGGTGSANTLLGQQGDDTYYVDASGDSVYELANEGTDSVHTTLASFTLPDNVETLAFVGTGAFTGIGNVLANQLAGGAGDDFLSGLDGDDTITGRSGADLMLGGNGSDTFRYAGGESGYDRITDFAPAADRIALASTYYGHTATVAFRSGAGAAANSASSTFLYDTNTGIVSYDADGTGAGAAVRLAQLNTGLTLTLANFGFY